MSKSLGVAQRIGRLMKSILDPSFHYVPSTSTDLRKTFARIRREQRKWNQIQAAAETEVMGKVLSLTPRKLGAAS